MMRARHFDEIVDAQGLGRTAMMARLARGRHHGYDRASVRESFATRFYDVTHTVDRKSHAVVRNRALAGLSLGYAPDGVARSLKRGVIGLVTGPVENNGGMPGRHAFAQDAGGNRGDFRIAGRSGDGAVAKVARPLGGGINGRFRQFPVGHPVGEAGEFEGLAIGGRDQGVPVLGVPVLGVLGL